MTLFKVRNRKVADLPYLLRLVLRFIYEPEKMSLYETELMERSVVSWSNRLIKREGEQSIIERIGWMLKKNQEGYFDKRKAMFREHNINWQKFHRLPEAWDINYAPRFN